MSTGGVPSAAITRAVSPALADCQLTHLTRQPIDVARAQREHAAYEDALRGLGLAVVRAAPAPDCPDAVFVEDCAVVLDEAAIITRPGAPSRRAETTGIAEALRPHRPLRYLEAPACLDGGDVLRIGRTLYVGTSTRTTPAAVAQLARLVAEWDYRVVPVPVTGCLHLKSAVTLVDADLVLANAAWIETEALGSVEVLPVHEGEPAGGNALWVAGAVIYPEHHPQTARRLADAGCRLVTVPAGELAKAEGGVTCCSLIV